MQDIFGTTDGNGGFGGFPPGERNEPTLATGTLDFWRAADAPPRGAPPPMGFAERFVSLETTPRAIALGVEEDNGRFAAVCFQGRAYKPTDRFLKGLARRMKVPVGVFTLFSPVEVVHRAAAVAPDLGLRVTLDEEKGEALGLIENTGRPIPADAVERVMKEDGRLQRFGYANGVIEGMFDIGESWSVPGDSDYRVQVRASVPVDGMDAPDATLGLLRQVCSNGAVVEAASFRTKLEIKDNSGEHFRRLLASFGNPQGIEALHERLVAAAGTKASVGEVHAVDEFLRRQVRRAEDAMHLRERLQEIAGHPCVRYGVADIGAIGPRRRALLPVDCPVSDVMNFVTELCTHHPRALKDPAAGGALVGRFCTGGFDLEEMYPNTRESPAHLLGNIRWAGRAEEEGA